jgi:ADP-ribose pyrophosphatase YjhB (NUDIX family)
MEIVVNKYDDTIITCDSIRELLDYEKEYVKNDNKQSVVIKTKLNLYSFADFEFVFSNKETNVYVNTKAKLDCPAIINGQVYASCVIVIVNNSSIVLVKDKGRTVFSNPSGSFSHSSETFKECALRETFEETGIEITGELIECGNACCEKSVFGMLLENTIKMFYTHVSLSEDQIKSMLAYKTEEIKQVILVPPGKLINYKISPLHKSVIWYVIKKLRRHKENRYHVPDHVKKFDLF